MLVCYFGIRSDLVHFSGVPSSVLMSFVPTSFLPLFPSGGLRMDVATGSKSWLAWSWLHKYRVVEPPELHFTSALGYYGHCIRL